MFSLMESYSIAVVSSVITLGVQHFCKNCGVCVSPRPKCKTYKSVFCSNKCHNDYRSKGRPWLKEALRLHQEYDYGSILISKKLRISRQAVRSAFKRLGLKCKCKNRFRLPNGQFRSAQLLKKTNSLIMELYNKERVALKKYDAERHWRNHPEVIRARVEKYRSRVNQNAMKYYRIAKDGRLNRYFASRIRTRIYCVLKGIKKSARTTILLGCSIEQLRTHLASRFKRGMNWNNYGTAWHIDHIIPCHSFDLSKEHDQRKCFHYSNLQPLWSKDNLSKAKRIHICQPELLLSLSQ